MTADSNLNGQRPHIYFFHPDEQNGWLSNFSLHPILVEGILWPTVEHFFQANKFHDLIMRESVRSAASPGDAKQMGKDLKERRRPDWSRIKEQIMLVALRAKFRQHPDLAQRLIKTLDAELIEDSPDDVYWGIGITRRGSNRLGHLLMKVRSELQQKT